MRNGGRISFRGEKCLGPPGQHLAFQEEWGKKSEKGRRGGDKDILLAPLWPWPWKDFTFPFSRSTAAAVLTRKRVKFLSSLTFCPLRSQPGSISEASSRSASNLGEVWES